MKKISGGQKNKQYFMNKELTMKRYNK